MVIIMHIFVIIITALFLIRDSSFLESVPQQYHKDFMDINPVATQKLEMLKRMLRERFGVSSLLVIKIATISRKIFHCARSLWMIACGRGLHTNLLITVCKVLYKVHTAFQDSRESGPDCKFINWSKQQKTWN